MWAYDVKSGHDYKEMSKLNPACYRVRRPVQGQTGHHNRRHGSH
jgi:hypothetical protein